MWISSVTSLPQSSSRNVASEEGYLRTAKRPGAGPSSAWPASKFPRKPGRNLTKLERLGRKKKYDEALQRLQKATEIYPEYAEAFNEMGAIYLRKKQKTEALKAFEQAIAADPNWVSAYVNLGLDANP